ncbi:MAG TPA: hypothetical protein VF026_27210 [Ktedonobacteraceae bacterium]
MLSYQIVLFIAPWLLSATTYLVYQLLDRLPDNPAEGTAASYG